jgi:S-adenosylmethionine:tRNA ribosyltransferase-isomerase
VDVEEFDYELPAELIAQEPLPERDAGRLMVLPREKGEPDHRMIRDLPGLLQAGDVLVVNDARVIPARLRGRKEGTGGKVEILLVEPLGGADWLALAQSSNPLRPGAAIEAHGARLTVVEARGEGELVVRLPLEGEALWRYLDEAGEMPLPPYIERPANAGDDERYQTIFARERGAVAAPTAGLHFTPRLLEELRAAGVRVAPITLHVGPGTFLPVRARRVEDHRMHRERYDVPAASAEAVASAPGRVIAVGTTALRTLEAAHDGETIRAGPGTTDLFIAPGYRFRAVQGLLTNFHLPRSTLLMLVSAFAGLPRIQAAYREGVARRYRFFSYGDAMLIL